MSRFVKLIHAMTPAPIWNAIKEHSRAAAAAATRQELAKMPLWAKLEQVPTEISDTNTALQQLHALLRHEAKIPPPPPKHLQVRVVGGYVPGFIESGYSICDDLDRALQTTGKTLEDFPRVLDFGCGCGRVIRAIKSRAPESRLHGTDIDAEAISWLSSHYSQFGEFAVAPHHPPTVYEDSTFDLIVGLSVFTHLPEDMQFAWLGELKRISRKGGYVLLSTHGETHYNALPDEAQRVMKEKGFLYSDFGFNYGASISLPDFYQTSFHSHAYLRREWSKYFEVVDLLPLNLDRHQDMVLLRRTSAEGRL